MKGGCAIAVLLSGTAGLLDANRLAEERQQAQCHYLARIADQIFGAHRPISQLECAYYCSPTRYDDVYYYYMRFIPDGAASAADHARSFEYVGQSMLGNVPERGAGRNVPGLEKVWRINPVAHIDPLFDQTAVPHRTFNRMLNWAAFHDGRAQYYFLRFKPVQGGSKKFHAHFINESMKRLLAPAIASHLHIAAIEPPPSAYRATLTCLAKLLSYWPAPELQFN